MAIAPVTRFTNGPLLNAGAAGTAHHRSCAHTIGAKEMFGAITNAAIIGAWFIDIALRFTLTPREMAKQPRSTFDILFAGMFLGAPRATHVTHANGVDRTGEFGTGLRNC